MQWERSTVSKREALGVGVWTKKHAIFHNSELATWGNIISFEKKKGL